MKKIYLAGPDVFEQNSKELGNEYVRLCKQYGYEGLYPLDNEINFNQSKHNTAREIFLANKFMIEQSDIVIANLNSFRGMEPDSGTVWECGYASALGKKVYAYMKDNVSYINRFSDSQKNDNTNGYIDNDGMLIEDFDLPLNLMISCSVEKIIQGKLEDVLKVMS